MWSLFLMWRCSFSNSEGPPYPRDHFSYQSGDQNTPWSIIQLKVHQDGILMLNYDILAQNDKVEKSQNSIKEVCK